MSQINLFGAGILRAFLRELIRPFLREPILGKSFAIFYHLKNEV
jgi:hypothetical protein